MSKLLFALVLLAAPVAAQNVIFHEGFESGIVGWTGSGAWNAESATDACAAPIAPFPEGTGAAYYGVDGACNYEGSTGTSGSLILDTWIDLPAGATAITLRYWSWSSTEYCWSSWDVHEIRVLVDGGSTFASPYCSTFGPHSAELNWHERRVNLTALAGQRIRPSFHFHTGDEALNSTRGWFVDDVSIVVESGTRMCPSGSIQSDCPCSLPFVPVAGGCRNSTNQSAVLFASGSVSVSGDTLELKAVRMTPNASAILAQATANVTSIPFGDGIRCIGGSILRMGAQTASSGVATWPPAGTDPIALRGLVPAVGGTRYYYVNYRDVMPYCTSATFNLTDTQRIVWVP